MPQPVLSDCPQVFLDTETTGLDERRHEIWELGALRRHPDGLVDELLVQLPVDLGRADPDALAYGGFDGRYVPSEAVTPAAAVSALAAFADGAVLLGLNIAFDLRFLSRLMERVPGAVATWHYSAVDVKSVCAGALRMAPPWRSDAIAAALRVDPAAFARHSALGDCSLAAAMFDAAMALHGVV